MLIPLSYPLTRDAPLYPGIKPLAMEEVRSIAGGDPANQSELTLSAHAGTHLDAPRHFCAEGRTIADMLEYGSIFRPAYCLDIPKKPGEPVSVEDFSSFTGRCRDAAALLVRTGAYACRNSDPDTYTLNHPWVRHDVPDYLREHFPSLQLFGIDAISLNHPAHREEGRACHRSFLCGGSPLLVLEDADLGSPALSGKAFSLHIFPWVLEHLDGVPVCALAEIDDKRNSFAR